MHQPTRDPRDQSKVEPTTFNHNMGKGSSPDNQLFEQVAAQAGVEMVFLGHIRRRTAIASIKLGRPAQIEARVRRGRRVVATVLPNTCANGSRAVRWDAKGAKPGRYTLEVRVRSDRPTVVRKLGFSVR